MKKTYNQRITERMGEYIMSKNHLKFMQKKKK